MQRVNSTFFFLQIYIYYQEKYIIAPSVRKSSRHHHNLSDMREYILERNPMDVKLAENVSVHPIIY